jgi:hypothetical protein
MLGKPWTQRTHLQRRFSSTKTICQLGFPCGQQSSQPATTAVGFDRKATRNPQLHIVPSVSPHFGKRTAKQTNKTMREILIILIGIIFSLNGFGQSEVKVRFLPAKIDSRTEMLIPIENGKYLYENYSYFKYVYWLIKQDTLTQKSDSVYSGESLTVNMNNDFVFKNPCDSLVNYIRNSSLSHSSSSMLDDTARLYIGYDNEEFKNNKIENRPSKTDEYKLCHKDFQKLNTEWFDQQLDLIKSIKTNKEKRYELIKKSDSIDYDFILKFLSDFGSCEPDYFAIVELISKNADGFLRVCKNMTDTDFFVIKLKLSDLPESIKTDLAINSLKNSNIKTTLWATFFTVTIC